jgi:nicotinamidase-related amidase
MIETGRLDTALVVIDVQEAFDDPGWGRRNNREADRNIADLVDAFGNAGLPMVYVQHESLKPGSCSIPTTRGTPSRTTYVPRRRTCW